MGADKTISIFEGTLKYLMCPLCCASFKIAEGKSFICENGHCFDISAKGYVNFIPHQKQNFSHYNKKLFESRARVFESGAYDNVLDIIHDMTRSNFSEISGLNLLDAGCGEGYFAAKMGAVPGVSAAAADISRDAIVTACRRKAPVKWMVADLSRLPFKNDSFDVILNIMSVANYDEFKRVLAEGGMIIKVVPGRDYLKEIREIAGLKLYNKEYSNEDVVEYFEKRVNIIEKKSLNYQWPVDDTMFKFFTEMTPMTQAIDKEMMDTGRASHITIDLDILAGKPCRS